MPRINVLVLRFGKGERSGIAVDIAVGSNIRGKFNGVVFALHEIDPITRILAQRLLRAGIIGKCSGKGFDLFEIFSSFRIRPERKQRLAAVSVQVRIDERGDVALLHSAQERLKIRPGDGAAVVVRSRFSVAPRRFCGRTLFAGRPRDIPARAVGRGYKQFLLLEQVYVVIQSPDRRTERNGIIFIVGRFVKGTVLLVHFRFDRIARLSQIRHILPDRIGNIEDLLVVYVVVIRTRRDIHIVEIGSDVVFQRSVFVFVFQFRNDDLIVLILCLKTRFRVVQPIAAPAAVVQPYV